MLTFYYTNGHNEHKYFGHLITFVTSFLFLYYQGGNKKKPYGFFYPHNFDYVKLLYLKNKFDIYNSIKKYSLIPLLIVGILLCFDPLMIGLSLLEVALLGNH
jgi:hypothetical protein